MSILSQFTASSVDLGIALVHFRRPNQVYSVIHPKVSPCWIKQELWHVILCYVMLCYVMLCYVMLCYVMLCYVMLCYVML